jgi:protein-tyrosine phosphatase
MAPFLAEGIRSLEIAAEIIDNARAGDQRILVHCGAGSERAPLTVAWFLHRRRAMTLDEAYDKRPIVQDRRFWLRQYLGQ